MSNDTPPTRRPVVVVPTYENGATVAAIARRVLDQGWDCIVVDDGSTDGTATRLAELKPSRVDPTLVVLTHAHNRGKAAALATGFEHAQARGYTHAITLDADGQHDPEQAGDLWRYAQAHPDELVLGERPEQAEGGTPWRSAFGRRVSNALVRLQSGVVVSDSQTGFRVYPLAALDELGCGFSRFAFETEVLVRAGRAGVRVGRVPIRSRYHAPAERVSHFAPVRDSLHSLAMHAALLPGQPLLKRFAHTWLRHQLLYLPLFAFLFVGFARADLAPEPRWHPAFLTGAAIGLAVLAIWRRLKLGVQPLPAACILFLSLGALGVLSRGTPLYPIIHHSYGTLRELALHLWVAAVCLLLAMFRPAWLLGLRELPSQQARNDAWVVAGFALASVLLGWLLRPAHPVLAGMLPFLMVLVAQGFYRRRTLGRSANPPATPSTALP